MFARRARPPQRGRPTRTTQILKDKNACRTPCPAPVWWFERCAQNPIPSRTRPLNTPAPMVLCLKARESRSPPDPHNANTPFPRHDHRDRPRSPPHRRSASPDQPHNLGAGWSSPVARQAHNLKVTGSNPVPATKSLSTTRPIGKPGSLARAGFSAFGVQSGANIRQMERGPVVWKRGGALRQGRGPRRSPARRLALSRTR